MLISESSFSWLGSVIVRILFLTAAPHGRRWSQETLVQRGRPSQTSLPALQQAPQPGGLRAQPRPHCPGLHSQGWCQIQQPESPRQGPRPRHQDTELTLQPSPQTWVDAHLLLQVAGSLHHWRREGIFFFPPTCFLIEEWHMTNRLIFKFRTWLFFCLKEASKGWVGHNHRPSTQWIIIYRLVVFLNPPFHHQFLRQLNHTWFQALNDNSYSFGMWWDWRLDNIWNNKEHLEALLVCYTVPDTQPDQSGVKQATDISTRGVPSPLSWGQKEKTISSKWLNIEQKILDNHIIYKKTCTDPSVCSRSLKVALFSYFIASNVPLL